MQASIVLLLFVVDAVYSGPIRGSCERYNPFTWEVYRIMSNKPREYNECVNTFTDYNYNINYCSGNSIITLNIVQGNVYKYIHTQYYDSVHIIDTNERPPVAMTTSSGSGAHQSTIVNDQKCKFNVNFTFGEGRILGGEVQLYNHKTSNDKYQVKLYNKTVKDELVLIQTTEISTKEERNWNKIDLNEFLGAYGEGNFQVYFYAQFIRNNEEISCKAAQTIFTTNCMDPANIAPPAMVIITHRVPIVLRSRRSNEDKDEEKKCILMEQHSSTGTHSVCVDQYDNVCEAHESKEITKATIEGSTAIIDTDLYALSC